MLDILFCRMHLAELRKELQFWRAWIRSQDRPTTKHDLEELGKKLMSGISEFAAKQNAFNDRIDTAVSEVKMDVEYLQATIEKLQNNPGPISSDDQKLLDDLQARTEGVVNKLEALDAMTPPPPPVV